MACYPEEEIVSVLVVVSLVLSILNLTLMLRTNGTNITQSTLDPLDLETVKADSLELKIIDEFSDVNYRLWVSRLDNETSMKHLSLPTKLNM